MANGFFLGGVQEGMAANAKRDLEERTLASDTSLRSRGLDIQQGQLDRASQQSLDKRADEEIASTMSVVGETIKSAIQAGKDPQQILRTVQPLVDAAKLIASKVGRNPAALDAQVKTQLFQPTATEIGTAKGTEKAATTIAEQKGLADAGVEISPFKDPKDKVSAENALRDDFLKQAQNFVTMRDAKNRIDNLEPTGAGDMALVFQYMKMLDPGSTVREGEYATAVNAAGVPSAIQGIYNRVVGGGQLGAEARKQITSQANKIYDTAALQHDKLQTKFAGVAKRQGLNPDNVVIDLSPAATGFDARFDAATPGGVRYRLVKPSSK